MSHRFEPGQSFSVSGIRFRVIPGRKLVDGKVVPGDLRLENLTGTGWRPTDMALAFMLVDFFGENEDNRAQYEPTWTRTGTQYFFEKLGKARADGWEATNAELQEQRQRRRIPTQPAVPVVSVQPLGDLDSPEFDAAWQAAERTA